MKKYLLATCLFGANIAYGACYQNWCEGVYIERLYPISGSYNILVATSGDETALDCSAEVGVYVTLNTEKTNGDLLYSTLLTAQATNRTMTVRTHEGSKGCEVKYLILDKP